MQVCLTAGAGYGMAPGELSLATAVLATLGTAMASAAANTINQILEVPFDSQMGRTKVLTLFSVTRSRVTTLPSSEPRAGAWPGEHAARLHLRGGAGDLLDHAAVAPRVSPHRDPLPRQPRALHIRLHAHEEVPHPQSSLISTSMLLDLLL